MLAILIIHSTDGKKLPFSLDEFELQRIWSLRKKIEQRRLGNIRLHASLQCTVTHTHARFCVNLKKWSACMRACKCFYVCECVRECMGVGVRACVCTYVRWLGKCVLHVCAVLHRPVVHAVQTQVIIGERLLLQQVSEKDFFLHFNQQKKSFFSCERSTKSGPHGYKKRSYGEADFEQWRGCAKMSEKLINGLLRN